MCVCTRSWVHHETRKQKKTRNESVRKEKKRNKNQKASSCRIDRLSYVAKNIVNNKRTQNVRSRAGGFELTTYGLLAGLTTARPRTTRSICHRAVFHILILLFRALEQVLLSISSKHSFPLEILLVFYFSFSLFPCSFPLFCVFPFAFSWFSFYFPFLCFLFLVFLFSCLSAVVFLFCFLFSFSSSLFLCVFNP